MEKAFNADEYMLALVQQEERVTDFLQKYEDFVRWYYGERCSDYEADCCICKAWKQFDKFADDVVETKEIV